MKLSAELATAASALLTKLWDRSHLLSWALAIGSFLGFAILAALALTGSPTFVDANNTASPWLLLASIIFATFAVIKNYEKWSVQTVKLFPDEQQSIYYGPIKQADGSITTQISVRFEVFNVTDKSIWLPDVTLVRPRSYAPIRMNGVLLKDQSSNLYGPYELPPHERTSGSVLLMIEEDLMDQIARKGVAVIIKDQFGHRHKLKLSKITRSKS
jgi:hypothetical protein